MSKEKDVNKAANVVMSAPKGTYYAAIRDLAYIVLEETPEDLRPTNDLEWGFKFAITRLVKENLPGLTLDTELRHDGVTAAHITNRVLKLCAKSGEGAK